MPRHVLKVLGPVDDAVGCIRTVWYFGQSPAGLLSVLVMLSGSSFKKRGQERDNGIHLRSDVYNYTKCDLSS